MAFHPFRSFQRNQKIWMAGATLLAIISFLFLGVIIQLIDAGRGGGVSGIETIAESRRFGKITTMELERLMGNQRTLHRFLSALQHNVALANPTDMERMQALAPLGTYIRQVERDMVPERLINIWLVTQHMQEEGFLPDWNDVKRLLTELTGGYLSDAIFDESRQAVGLSRQAVEQLLARQIQWQQAEMRFGLSMGAISPATRWDWFQRLHRQVTIEAVAIPVDAFVSQISEPTERQLNAFFEQHKNKRFNPMLAESGFIMPIELAFQYVVGAPSQQLLDSVTEEEMLVFYEEHKGSLFLRPQTPLLDLPQTPGMMPSNLPGGMFPAFPTPGRPTVPVMPEPTTTDTLETSDIPETTESPESTEATTEETSATLNVTTRFVSYQTDEAADAEMGENEEAVDSEELEEPMEANEPVDSGNLYRPFDEVKEQIRARLAYARAVEALPEILKEMETYAHTYHEHFEQGKQIPPMPDLTAFVTAHGLTLVTVPRGNVFDAMRTELARGYQEQQFLLQKFRHTPLLFAGEIFEGNEGRVLFWVTEEKSELKPDELDKVRDIVLERWKEVEARTLAMKRAEELANEAKASGKSLADVFSGRSDVPVVDTEAFTWVANGLRLIGNSLQRVPVLDDGGNPLLGEVRERGVDEGGAEFDNQWIFAPGSDFMEAVYSLQVGETAVVFNEPQTFAYIVRVTTSSPSTDALWEQFQAAHEIYLYAGLPDMIRESHEAWLDEIRTKAGFRWVNKPDARMDGF